ncbi:carboxylesterase family protein [Vibrio aestuarianus]|uniref:carboxylesterase family protein n=1 Tax=Vibrio aestuarianus TaxID=28171 RepID=UPI00237CBA96|nr:carboxylesterase family protein [Vibrio aestuarianus]MDE1225396.1 carboxylesterase family protein [Vibrio aestuarianus]MDE1340414.1 carboxylesterase family protein [Vibrio aestuarianus]
MQITKRSILAISIAALLSACGSDDSGNSGAPVKPEPLKPQPAQTVDVAVGNANVKAMKESLVITTAEGEEKLGSVESFKGITFAEAARFDHSNTVDFSGDIDATQFGDACPQIKATTQAQSEDCLNLNIWRPVGTVQGEDLPVYVFIHGGDFEYGSGANPMIHGDKVVAQGADEGNPFIAVTFNYRLGLLGSNWVKGTDVNGNYGLGDQETLLKWVQDNIQDFGGNAGNVTLMGQGSGAMSIALLQQKVAERNIDESYFQRAIMQSMPYGFEYKSYNTAKGQEIKEELKNAPLDELLNTQSKELEPLNTLGNWLTSSVNPLAKSTPMATLMPYAPYLECSELKDSIWGGKTDTCKDEMGKPQPSQENFVVPTVIGVNAKDSGSMSFLPNLMSLVPLIIDLMGEDTGDAEYTAQRMAEWLSVNENKQLVEARIQTLASSDEFSAQLDLEDLIEQLPKSAYEAITQLFFGLKNDTGSNLLALADFYPNDEHELSGAFDNMGQYRTIMNDMLFTGSARLKAAQSEAATMYYFDHSPSFNVWTYNTGPNGEVDFGDLLKSISCATGACNGSELPFVFNKAIKMDGTETHPSSKDKKLMNEMSRVWFSDELFSDYQYDATQDSILLIDENGVHLSAQDWDRTENKGIDAKLRNGRLSGLEDQGILMNYLQD